MGKNKRARPIRTVHGGYLRLIDQRIKELGFLIEDIRREKARYLRACQAVHGPGGMKGVDYSQTRVSGGGLRLEFADAMLRIDGCTANMNKLIEERDGLKKQRKNLVELYRKDKSLEAQVFYLREVLGYTQEQAAAKIGYSVRQLQRIEKRMVDNDGVRF